QPVLGVIRRSNEGSCYRSIRAAVVPIVIIALARAPILEDSCQVSGHIITVRVDIGSAQHCLDLLRYAAEGISSEGDAVERTIIRAAGEAGHLTKAVVALNGSDDSKTSAGH